MIFIVLHYLKEKIRQQPYTQDDTLMEDQAMQEIIHDNLRETNKSDFFRDQVIVNELDEVGEMYF